MTLRLFNLFPKTLWLGGAFALSAACASAPKVGSNAQLTENEASLARDAIESPVKVSLATTAVEGPCYTPEDYDWSRDPWADKAVALGSAFSEIQAKAEAGDPVAEFQRGLFSVYGVKVERDLDVASEWFEKAEAQGNADATYFYGYYFEFKDQPEKAETYYQKAAKLGQTDALHILGLRALGNGDMEKGRAYLEEGAKRGGSPAAVLLFGIAEEVEKFQEAVTFLKPIAEAGDMEAQATLGKYYADPDYDINDGKEARKWLEKAAIAGNAEAQEFLGMLYYSGNGGEKNDKFARQCLELPPLATMQPQSRYILGILYEEGLGGAKDLEKAKAAFQSAAYDGLEEAEEKINALD